MKNVLNKSNEIKKESLSVLADAHRECEKKIEMSEVRAEKLSSRLVEECGMVQAENEIVMSKLQAVVESHGQCLKKSQDVFEEHDHQIHQILNDSVKKDEIFEDKNYQIKYAQESLEKQTNKKFDDLESKVRSITDDSNSFETNFSKVNLLVNKNLFISTAVPILGVIFLCFWVHILTVTLPDTIFQETNPNFVDINNKIKHLNSGIKSTDSETFLELQSAKKSVEHLENTVVERMDTFAAKFDKQFNLLEEKIESYEDSVDVFNSDVDALRLDLSEQFSNFQSGIIEQFTEASIRYNEFMIPKIWISFASLRDDEGGKNKVNDALNLGLYREDGVERQRPVYKQVDGFYKLVFTAESRWVLVSLDRSEEDEVIIQANPKVPELSAKKWEVATHKVNIVHEIPCCKNMMMKHSNLTSTGDTRLSLVGLVRGGRGVWRTKQGTVLHFNMKKKQWQVKHLGDQPKYHS